MSLNLLLFVFSVNVCVHRLHGEAFIFKDEGAGGGGTELREYDVCNRTNGVVWTCQKLKNCSEAVNRVKRGDKPFVCGFEGMEPIVCCKLAFIPEGGTIGGGSPFPVETNGEPPPRAKSERLTKDTTSLRKCVHYSRFYCRDQRYLTTLKESLPSSWTEHTTSPWFPVLGGAESKPKEFPHMALIGYGDVPDQISWQCGGSLISEDFVLSAAHCTFPGPEIGMAKYVRMGDLNTATDTDDAQPQQFEIIERINHPDYEPSLLYNDIALYRMNRRATFNSYVRPICLYQSDSVPEGAGVVTGWGRIEVAGPVSKNLQKANVTFFDAGQCNQLLSSTRQIPRGIDQRIMMCAGELDGSRDTCQGDSGGPLSVQEELQITCLATQIGITSFGKQCGLPNSPGVYTKVANYLPWIESIVWPGPGPF